jgi:hypothetical protein
MHADRAREHASRIKLARTPDTSMLHEDDVLEALSFWRTQMVELARRHVERRNRIGDPTAGCHKLLALGAYLIAQGCEFTASPDEEALNLSYDTYRRYLECEYSGAPGNVVTMLRRAA